MTENGTLILAPSTGFAMLSGSPFSVASGGSFTTTGAANIAYLRTALTNQAGGTVSMGAANTQQDSNTATTNNGTLTVVDGGHLAISGSGTLVTSGRLGTTVNATGPTTSGISGTSITLGGTFQVNTIGSPIAGTTFTPVTGTSISGSFTGLEYGPHGYTTTVSATAVTIKATALPFSVTPKTFSATAHEPATYPVASVTTLLGTPTYTATVNWGDGNTTSATVTAGAVKAKHSFAAGGTYTVTTSVHGSNGTTLTASKLITVAADPVPTVTGVSPATVADGGSYTLTITGTGLTDNAVPTFSAAGIAVTSTTYVSPTKLTVKVSVAKNTPVGAGNVTVATDGGSGTCTGCLTVDAAPKLTTITPVPAHGTSTVLTVTGTGFQAGLGVASTVPGATFGPITAQTATTFNVQITIPGTTAAGTYKLTVTNPDGGKGTKTLTVS